MADDLLKELLTSPLERPTRRTRRHRAQEDDAGIVPDGRGARGADGIPRVPFLWALGAAALGALIVLAGYSIAADDTVPTTIATTTTVTTTPSADGSPSGLPEDYVAVGDHLGMRVERILARPDGVFVTITTVVENSLDPDATTGFQGGLWTLVLADGRRISSTSDSFDALARGTVSVWFPPEGFTPEDIVSLEVNGVAMRTTNSLFTETLTTTTLPEDGSAVTLELTPARMEIDAGVLLEMPTVTLSGHDATVEWSLGGETLASAAVQPIALTILEDGVGTTSYPGAFQSSGFTNFHPSIPGLLLGSGGTIGFTLPEGQTVDPGLEVGAGIDFSVTWAVYDPVVVSLPLDGVSVAVVDG